MEGNEIAKRQLAFDDCANVEDDVEFWYARDIMKPLGYTQWRRFEDAIKRAMASCESSETPAKTMAICTVIYLHVYRFTELVNAKNRWKALTVSEA